MRRPPSIFTAPQSVSFITRAAVAEGDRRAFLVGAERHVDDDEGALGAAHHRAPVHDHEFERHRHRRLVAVHHHAEAVAHQEKIAVAVGDRRRVRVVGGERHDGPVPFHGGDVGRQQALLRGVDGHAESILAFDGPASVRPLCGCPKLASLGCLCTALCALSCSWRARKAIPANEDLGLKPAYNMLPSEAFSMRTGAFLQIKRKSPPGAAGKSRRRDRARGRGAAAGWSRGPGRGAALSVGRLAGTGAVAGAAPARAPHPAQRPRRRREDHLDAAQADGPSGDRRVARQADRDLYDGTTKIATSPISSGMRGRETPTGIFSILEKNRYHYSNLYGGAPMPYMNRITNSGVAMHEGVVPGYPASHGCIRLPWSFARNLFGITEIGARVIVNEDDPTPAEFQSAHLIAPLPPGDDMRQRRGSNVIGVTPAAAEVAPKQRTRAMAAARTSRAARGARPRHHGGRATARRRPIDYVKIDDRPRAPGEGQHPQGPQRGGPASNAARKAARDAEKGRDRFVDLTRKMSAIEVDKLDTGGAREAVGRGARRGDEGPRPRRCSGSRQGDRRQEEARDRQGRRRRQGRREGAHAAPSMTRRRPSSSSPTPRPRSPPPS